jgi:hypothetical protein
MQLYVLDSLISWTIQTFPLIYSDKHSLKVDQINQPTSCNSFTSSLLDVYVQLNMFRPSPRPSSGAYKCSSSLWFYRWSVVVAALLFVVWPVTTLRSPRYNCKTRGCYCSCKLLMMDEETPETCWPVHKRQIMNLWNCCSWLVDLFELYEDARTGQRQARKISMFFFFFTMASRK